MGDPFRSASSPAILLHPALQHIAIRVYRGHSLHGTQETSVHLGALIVALPNLTSLVWEGGSNNLLPRALELLGAQSPARLRGLRMDSCMRLPRPALLAISRFVNLEELSLGIDAGGESDPPLPPLDLPTLQTLSVSGRTFDIARVLSVLVSPNLSSLALTILRHERNPALDAALAALPPTLTTLDMRVKRILTPPPTVPLAEVLQPALGIPTLTHADFALEDSHLVTAREEDYAALAGAWPRLHALDIEFEHGRAMGEGGEPGVQALVAFARGCPDLVALTLPVLACANPPPAGAVPVFDHGLRSLVLADMFAGQDAEGPLRGQLRVLRTFELAQLLDRMFPNLDLSDEEVRREYWMSDTQWWRSIKIALAAFQRGRRGTHRDTVVPTAPL